MGKSLESLQERYASFVDDRDWDKYHTPQNLAIAISVEANELLENFLWFDNPSSDNIAADGDLMNDVEDEVADVLIYSMALANQLDIDLLDAVERKLEENEQRFDEEQASDLTEKWQEWQ